MIAFPIALPTSRAARSILFRAQSTVGASASPFTGEQQVFVHAGEFWEAEVALPQMKRVDAEQWIAFLLKLNGREGTFLMGDPASALPRGTWGSAPLVNGAFAAGVKTIAIKGLSAGGTGKVGDWIQLGSGASSRLHKVVVDFTADGSGIAAEVEIWPRTKAALANSDAIVKSSAKGLWRLATNQREWSIEVAQIYGLAFSCREAF